MTWLQVFAAIGAVFTMSVVTLGIGLLLVRLESRWPGITDRSGRAVWGRDWEDR